jgi:hypothetical protein
MFREGARGTAHNNLVYTQCLQCVFFFYKRFLIARVLVAYKEAPYTPHSARLITLSSTRDFDG